MPSVSLLLLLLLALVALAEATADSPECTVVQPDTNDLFDLRPLIKEKDDWTVSGLKTDTNQYHINVCHALNDASGIKSLKTAAYLKEDGETIATNIGERSTSPKITASGIVLHYTDGDNCPGTSDVQRETIINFTCDKNAGLGNPQFVDHSNRCVFMMEWKTSAACPTSTKSGGSVFVTVFSVIVSVYVIGGILYNRFKHGARGYEQIPNFAFWHGIYDFCKDMLTIIFGRCLPQRRPSVYRGLPRDEENGLIDDDFEEH